jgi:hypothetical protein
MVKLCIRHRAERALCRRGLRTGGGGAAAANRERATLRVPRPRGRRRRPAADVRPTRPRCVDGLLAVHLRAPAPASIRGGHRADTDDAAPHPALPAFPRSRMEQPTAKQPHRSTRRRSRIPRPGASASGSRAPGGSLAARLPLGIGAAMRLRTRPLRLVRAAASPPPAAQLGCLKTTGSDGFCSLESRGESSTVDRP